MGSALGIPTFTGRGCPMITLYGIKNCDTVKKARAWLDPRGIGYAFHDYKSVGVDPDQLAAWAKELGWERLLNRAGTTFRKLPDADKEGLDESKALRLMREQPSMIKRPLVDKDGELILGFKADQYEAAFG
jgi:arsenate reductase